MSYSLSAFSTAFLCETFPLSGRISYLRKDKNSFTLGGDFSLSLEMTIKVGGQRGEVRIRKGFLSALRLKRRRSAR